ncbi:MAG TPA: hypothetical protein PLC52_08720 [Anaerolineales bacterium]|nr:hypothetical protein [Anaerolineales bacterium]HRQ92932.1 hypothetical protein [Anaerolineales bacterium]
MWIPFVCVFAGMASEMFGEPGRQFANWVNGFVPGLMDVGSSGLSLLSNVAVITSFVLMVLAMLLLVAGPILVSSINTRLQATGTAATATVVSLSQTGTYINRNPMVRIVLEVHPPNGSPFHTEAERLTTLVDLPRLQPGASVSVRYDPETLDAAIVDL